MTTASAASSAAATARTACRPLSHATARPWAQEGRDHEERTGARRGRRRAAGQVAEAFATGMRFVERSAGPVLELLIRLALAQVFFVSGVLKAGNWDNALQLAAYEYPVAWMDPVTAAWLGVTVELVGIHSARRRPRHPLRRGRPGGAGAGDPVQLPRTGRAPVLGGAAGLVRGAGCRGACRWTRCSAAAWRAPPCRWRVRWRDCSRGRRAAWRRSMPWRCGCGWRERLPPRARSPAAPPAAWLPLQSAAGFAGPAALLGAALLGLGLAARPAAVLLMAAVAGAQMMRSGRRGLSLLADGASPAGAARSGTPRARHPDRGGGCAAAIRSSTAGRTSRWTACRGW